MDMMKRNKVYAPLLKEFGSKAIAFEDTIDIPGQFYRMYWISIKALTRNTFIVVKILMVGYRIRGSVRSSVSALLKM